MRFDNNSFEMMKESYGNMYKIENFLRRVIDEKLTNEYGIHWKQILSRRYKNSCLMKSFDKLNYHEIVSYFRILPVLSSIFSSKAILQLYELTPIRNKIAHNHIIAVSEYEKLKTVLDLVMESSKINIA